MLRLIAVALLLLAAPASAASIFQKHAVFAPNHGFAVAVFPKGGATLLMLEPVQGGADTAIAAPIYVEALSGAQAIGRWLPPGQYRLKAWNNASWRDGATFEVQAGRITSVGNFLAAPVGNYQIVLVPVDHPESDAVLAEVTRMLGGYLRNTEPLRATSQLVSPPHAYNPKLAVEEAAAPAVDAGSSQARITQKRMRAERDPATFLRMARSLSQPLTDAVAITPDGSLYMGADYGQLRKRSPAGEWSNLSIDTLRGITAVAYHDGNVIAGSDDGRLRISRDDGAHWTTLHSFALSESITGIARRQGDWIITTAQVKTDPKRAAAFWNYNVLDPKPILLRVYVGHHADASDLVVSRQVEVAPEDLTTFQGTHGTLHQDQFYVSQPPGLFRLDLASGQWIDISPNGKVGTHRVDAESGAITAYAGLSLLPKVWLSTDRGNTWTTMARLAWPLQDVQLHSPTQGWASRFNPRAGGTPEIYRYNAQGKQWDKAGIAPQNCMPLRLSSQLPVICIDPTGNIHAEHEGQWVTEFSAE